MIICIVKYKDKSFILFFFFRVRDSWSWSYCLKLGIGDRVEYCVMFGNLCCSFFIICFIRKFLRFMLFSFVRNIEINLFLKLFFNYY